MAGITAASRRINTDTFIMGFAQASDAYDEFIENESAVNLIAWATSDVFARFYDAANTVRTPTGFSFTDNGNGTATLTWTYAGGGLTMVAAPSTNHIKFTITACSFVASDDYLDVGLYLKKPGDPSTNKDAKFTGSNMWLYTTDGTISWGLATGQTIHSQSATNGSHRVRFWAAAESPVNATVGVYCCPTRKLPSVLQDMLVNIGWTATSDQKLEQPALFIVDQSPPGGTWTAGDATPLIALCKKWGVERIYFHDFSWRDHDNKYLPISGFSDCVTALKAANLKVGLHCFALSWKTAASGGGSFNDAKYAGETFVTAEPLLTSFCNEGHGVAVPTTIEDEYRAALIAGYAATGANGGIYLDGLEACDDEWTATPQWTSIFWRYCAQVTSACLAAGIPIFGKSGQTGATWALGNGLITEDMLDYDTEAAVDDLVLYRPISIGIGKPIDFGWWGVKLGSYRTNAMLTYLLRNAVGCHGYWTISGTIAELQAITTNPLSKIAKRTTKGSPALSASVLRAVTEKK